MKCIVLSKASRFLQTNTLRAEKSRPALKDSGYAMLTEEA